jgi:HKD family nuclease
VAPLSGNVASLLATELRAGRWSRFTAIVAFARMSGVGQVEPDLSAFTSGGGRADLTIGTDLRGTTYEAAWYLMNAVAPTGRVLLASSEPAATFHPKIYVFSDADPSDPDVSGALKRSTEASAVVGSSNLTGGGLFGNDEASLVWRPALDDSSEREDWESFIDAVASWLDPTDPAVLGVASLVSLIAEVQAGRLPQEIALSSTRSRRAAARRRTPRPSRRRAPPRRSLTGPAPPAPGLAPPRRPRAPASTPPGLSVLIARLAFGGSRRWPQWELNSDVLQRFFRVTAAGNVIKREAVTRNGTVQRPESTPLVIGVGRNRRLEFPEPDGRGDPAPRAALLVVVDRSPSAFRYAVLLPGDPPYAAIEALNRATPALGQHVAATKRVVITYAALRAVWPRCPL